MTAPDPQASFLVSRADLVGPVSDARGEDLRVARSLVAAASVELSVLRRSDGDLKRIDGWLSEAGLVLHAHHPDGAAATPASVHQGQTAIGALAQLVHEGDTDSGTRSAHEGRRFDSSADVLRWVSDSTDGPSSAVVVATRNGGSTRTLLRVRGAWAIDENGSFTLRSGDWATMLAVMLAGFGFAERSREAGESSP